MNQSEKPLRPVDSSEFIDRSFISELEIQHQTVRLARLIADDCKDADLLVIAVLKGAFIFAADLVRRLYNNGVRVEIDFIQAASYGLDVKSSGEIRILSDITIDLSDRAVLLIDDIIDSGLTLQFISRHLHKKGAKSVSTCVLLDKKSRRKVDFNPDYSGFEVPDYFLVGYGLDFAEKHRCHPFISILTDEEEK